MARSPARAVRQALRPTAAEGRAWPKVRGVNCKTAWRSAARPWATESALFCLRRVLSGARMHANYFRVGGVHQDLPPKLLDDIWAFCDPFLRVCDDIEGLLTENRIFKQRNVGIGVVKLADAWGWGFSGVMVRGSGAAWDLRKAQPYDCYSEL